MRLGPYCIVQYKDYKGMQEEIQVLRGELGTLKRANRLARLLTDEQISGIESRKIHLHRNPKRKAA